MKNAVDEAIDRSAAVLNLRDSIEEERVKAEQVTDEKQKRIHTSKGLCKRLKHGVDLQFFRTT